MDDKASIMQLEREFINAWNSGNAVKAADIYAEDGIRVDPFGVVSRGRKEIEEAYAQLLQGRMKGARIQWDADVRLLSRDIAVTQGPLLIQPAGSGGAIHGYTVNIWQKNDGRWRVMEEHPKLFPPSQR